MSVVSLRSVVPEDEAFLYRLYVSARQEEIASWGWSAEQATAFLRMQWLAQRSSYRMQFPDAIQSIILLDQESVGQCYIHQAFDNLRLIDLSMTPDYRNKGIGSAVIRNLQLEASHRRIPLLLSVTPGNPARRLYERLGFIFDDATDTHIALRWEPSNNI